jgi:hypothetical protein
MQMVKPMSMLKVTLTQKQKSKHLVMPKQTWMVMR